MKKVISIILLCIFSLTLAFSLVACGESENKTDPNAGHAHPIIAVKAKAATCGANGMKEHYYCEYCMSYFNDKEGKEATKKSALIIPATGEHVPGRDKPTELSGKWYHDLRCSKCTKTINAEPILCPDCAGWELDMTKQPTAKCLNMQCGKEFSISLT